MLSARATEKLRRDAVERIMALVQRQHRRPGAAAQIVIVSDDEVVLDRVLGCSPDALFYTYSSSKPFVALLVHLLAERRHLTLEDPVALYWPEFAQKGKGSITIRHVLQHRAGIPVAGGLLATVAHMHDWKRAVRDVERAKPRWPAGAVPAYHFISYGFILGELVQRVTRQSLQQVLHKEFLKPLGLSDIHLGLPDHALPRAVPVLAGRPSELINQWLSNRRRVRQAVIPAASISSNARQLARFYQTLLRGGECNGIRILEPATIMEARRPSCDGMIDAFIKRPVRWAQGFQLGGPSKDPRDISRMMGDTSSPDAFGHGGNASCITWADPTRRLVLAYLSNIQPPIDQGIQHLSEISDAVLAAV
jgi:CubicO group peptidase (beta-lactamase class C family)